jgi:hypothetical protein
VLATFDTSSGSLSFSAVNVGVAQYCDGSFALANGPSESIIGSNLQLLATTLQGPAGLPGGFSFSDTVLSIEENDAVRVDGTLTDLVVIPDNSVQGFDSVVVGTLVWEGSAVDLGSRYLIEKFYFSDQAAVFFRSNLLTATDNFTQNGEASGPLQLATTSTASSCLASF